MAEAQTATEVSKAPVIPENILAGFDNTVETKPAIFRFKKDKLGTKRPNVEISLPVPSVEGLANILMKGSTPEGKKSLELLLDCVFDQVRSVAAGIVADKEDINAENFPYASVLWDAIANMPKADRRTGPDQAVWEAFAKDYIAIMPGLTGKSVEAVTNATLVYLKKWSMVKTNKKVIGQLKEQLALYANNSKEAENFEEILTLLVEKADAYLKSDDVEQLIANL